MKSILRILVLGAVPILAVTMVADQTLAADKGSQLIFQTNIGPHELHLCCQRAAGRHGRGYGAGSVLQRIEMEMVVWYLRVIPHGTGTFWWIPLNHDDSGLGYGSGQ